MWSDHRVIRPRYNDRGPSSRVAREIFVGDMSENTGTCTEWSFSTVLHTLTAVK